MYIYILSFLVVSFISLCFFKKKFWENRYLVLFISGCVAILATLTTNYFTRNGLPTEIEVVAIKDLPTFYVGDTLLVDSVPYVADKDWDFEYDLDDTYHLCDTLLKRTTIAGIDTVIVLPKKAVTIMFYDMELKPKKTSKIGYLRTNGKENYKYFNIAYILPSPNDTTAFISRIAERYISESKWLPQFSLPRKRTITCFFIPPSEYETIPDSLLRTPPFVINYKSGISLASK